MSVNTGIPSAGQLAPLKGLQVGEEYGRRPTRLRPVGATELMGVPAGITVGPLGPYGTWNPPGGAMAVGEMLNWVSSKAGPQVAGLPKELTFPGLAFASAIMSRHVCGLDGLMSCEASSRWPSVPT